MKPTSIWALLLFILFFSQGVFAQRVLINEDGGEPDQAAILELRSTTKGILISRMKGSNRKSIANPAKGLLVYQTNGHEGFYYYNGVVWDTLDGKSVINSITEVSNSSIAVVRDIKGPGVGGGSFSAGSWETRDLNNLQGDSSFIDIDGATTFSLDSGIYEINIVAPARRVDVHQIRLYNVDSTSVVALGTTSNSLIASTTSELYTVIDIDVKTTYEIQHRCTTTNADSNSRGYGITWGNNVYTQVRIQKY